MEIIQGLEEKQILEVQKGGIRVKSLMLAGYLRGRLTQPVEPVPPQDPRMTRKVGVFMDFENTWPQVPSGVTYKDLGEALTHYAAQFGEVVCRWAVADPRNLTDEMGMRLGLEQAGFTVRFPRKE